VNRLVKYGLDDGQLTCPVPSPGPKDPDPRNTVNDFVTKGEDERETPMT